MFLDELSHQMMKIGDLLVRSRKGMINNEMDFGRVPDPRDPHLAEHFDCKWPSAVLSHSEVHRQYSNVSRAMDPLGTTGSDANDLLNWRCFLCPKNLKVFESESTHNSYHKTCFR